MVSLFSVGFEDKGEKKNHFWSIPLYGVDATDDTISQFKAFTRNDRPYRKNAFPSITEK